MSHVALINSQILVAPYTAVKCQKQTQVISTSRFGPHRIVIKKWNEDTCFLTSNNRTLLNTNGSLGDNFTRKIEKIPTSLFIVLIMPTWLDETRRQNSTNFWCGNFFNFSCNRTLVLCRFK
jgi:hypothetical protein